MIYLIYLAVKLFKNHQFLSKIEIFILGYSWCRWTQFWCSRGIKMQHFYATFSNAAVYRYILWRHYDVIFMIHDESFRAVRNLIQLCLSNNGLEPSRTFWCRQFCTNQINDLKSCDTSPRDFSLIDITNPIGPPSLQKLFT